jgi:hypothetical protein
VPPASEGTSPIDGHVLTDQEAAKVRRQRPGSPRSHLPETARPIEYQQLTEFVELAHRLRVPSLKDKLAIGAGEWVSTAAARSAAYVISTYLLVGARDADEMTDKLMRPLLVVSLKQADGEDIGVDLPIACSHGRILIDTSMSAGGSPPPHFRLVRVNERPELWPASSPPETPTQADAADAGARADADAHAAGAEPDRSAGTAAVIWGSAAAIAGGHPYLSIEALMSYARKNAFASADDGGAASAEQAMRAARDLEVVVLLDQSMGGGLWIDVDRENGQPAAVLAVELHNAAERDAIKVTALPGS